jgi:1-acyl-sn-glycerol-3-phosphate acyltransferase
MSAARRRSPGRKAKAPPRPVRPVLGNDPFARGAAPRIAAGPGRPARPAPIERTPPDAPPQPPAAVPPTTARRVNGAAPGVPGDLQARLDAALGEAEARHAAAEAAGEPPPAEALGGLVAQLWPVLRERLGAVGGLLRLLEPAQRIDRFGMDPVLVERVEPLVEFLYGTWWRVVARALEHVPAQGPAVVVANHAGLLPWDALVLRHALGRDHPAHRDLRSLLDDAACDRPVVGGLAVRLGAVRATPPAAARLLGDGGLVGVFPEGSAAEARPWRDRYRVGWFGRGGFVKVALRAGAPIIPCAIVGSEEAAPAIARNGFLADLLKLPLLAAQPGLRIASAGLLPLPSRWSLRFGPAIDLGDAGPARADDPAFVAAATERTRLAIQAMLDQDTVGRASVYL